VNSGFVGRVLKEIAIKKRGEGRAEIFAACVVWLEIGLGMPPRSGTGVLSSFCTPVCVAPSQNLMCHPGFPRCTVLHSFTAFVTKVLLVSWIFLRPSIELQVPRRLGLVCFIHHFILSI